MIVLKDATFKEIMTFLTQCDVWGRDIKAAAAHPNLAGENEGKFLLLDFLFVFLVFFFLFFFFLLKKDSHELKQHRSAYGKLRSKITQEIFHAVERWLLNEIHSNIFRFPFFFFMFFASLFLASPFFFS